MKDGKMYLLRKIFGSEEEQSEGSGSVDVNVEELSIGEGKERSREIEPVAVESIDLTEPERVREAKEELEGEAWS